ncbi:MAG: putative O-methyltransferase [Firmicutes bacterium]|nr:putative O-methyltransferase [Bacillota bacterium]
MNELLQRLEVYAVQNHVPIIGKDSVRLLTDAVMAKKPRAVLEIGTAIAYSTLLIAANAAEDAKITTIELDPARAEMARKVINQASRQSSIEVVEGDAAQILPELTGPFDLVFIDAAKGQYLKYLLQVIDKLLPGAVIIADNILFRGMVKGGAVVPRRYRTIVTRLRAYLDFVTTDLRFDTIVHETGDGVAVTYYRGENNH